MSKGRIKGQVSEKDNCFFPFGGQMCAVIIAVQFSLWTGTAAREPQPFSAKVPNALPMHCKYTATANGVRMQSTLVHSMECSEPVHLSPVLPSSGQHEGLTCPGLPLKSHLFCWLSHLPTGLPVKSGLPLCSQTGGIQCSWIAIEKSFVLCSPAIIKGASPHPG